MSEIVKCSCCHKIFTRKQFDAHKCGIPWKSSKEIPVLYYIKLSLEEKDKILGVGLDGVRYFFVVKKPTPIPFIHSSDESLHDHESDEDLTEPSRVKNISYFCSVNIELRI
jgi:hypothetical protein